MSHCLELVTLDAFHEKIKREAKGASDKTLRKWQEAYDRQKSAIERGETRAAQQLAEERRLKALAQPVVGDPIPPPQPNTDETTSGN